MARSDYGIWQPVLKCISAESGVRLWLYVGGMHLEECYGLSVRMIEQDGYTIKARIPMDMQSNDARAVAWSIGAGVQGFADAFAEEPPDLLCVLGDRFDMIPAVLAAAPYRIPVAHVHGGEITEGAIDELFRHAITKMSHLHFASTLEYAGRIMQMGEEPWRVTVSGAPSLDHLYQTPQISRAELSRRCGLSLDCDPLLITYHPATLDPLPVEDQINSLLDALALVSMPLIFTLPNADEGGHQVARMIKEFVHPREHAVLVDNLGAQAYFSMMRISAAMVGNSSSGIIEAASLGLPVVNIGMRQQGRARNANVIDCPCSAAAIRDGLKIALDPAFRVALKGVVNIYGDGHAAQRIVDRLLRAEHKETLLHKRFAGVAMENL